MAASGVKITNITTNLDIRFSWEIKDQSVPLNNSTVSWKAELVAGDYVRLNSTAEKAYSLLINNNTIATGTNTIGIQANETKQLASGQFTLEHNVDGTKTFSFKYSQELEVIYSGVSYSTKYVQGTGELDTINRVSNINSLGGTIGNAIVINIRSYGNFKHTLKYSFGSASGTIGSGYNAKATWHSSVSLHNQLTSTQTEKDCIITCETYTNDNIYLGSTTATIKLKADEAVCAPTVSATIKDTNTQTTLLTNNNQIFIRYQSNGAYSISASGKYGATIKSYEVRHSGGKWTTASGTISRIENNTVDIVVVDSRGYKTTLTKTLNLVEYINLTCDLVAEPPTTSGKAHLSISGNYYDGAFTSTETNVIIVVYRYKVNDGAWGGWQSSAATITTGGGKFSQEVDISGLNYENSYTFQARVADKILTIESAERKVKTTPIFDWGENDFRFNVPVYTAKGHNLEGLAKAFTTNYSLTTTSTINTSDYTSGSRSASAILMGNNLRVYFYRTGVNQAVGEVNKTLGTLTIKHDGKIKSLYQADFIVGRTGLGYGSILNAKNDGTNITFDIRLNTVAMAFTGNVNIYFQLPVCLNLDAY